MSYNYNYSDHITVISYNNVLAQMQWCTTERVIQRSYWKLRYQYHEETYCL